MVHKVLDDYLHAPIEEKLRAMLGFLEKLTLHPDEVGPGDMVPLRALGISDDAVLDAVDVCVAFNIINRVADATGFALQTPEGYALSAQMLLKRGYK